MLAPRMNKSSDQPFMVATSAGLHTAGFMKWGAGASRLALSGPVRNLVSASRNG
jgi:hypothetical protein